MPNTTPDMPNALPVNDTTPVAIMKYTVEMLTYVSPRPVVTHDMFSADDSVYSRTCTGQDSIDTLNTINRTRQGGDAFDAFIDPDADAKEFLQSQIDYYHAVRPDLDTPEKLLHQLTIQRNGYWGIGWTIPPRE